MRSGTGVMVAADLVALAGFAFGNVRLLVVGAMVCAVAALWRWWAYRP